MKKVRLIESGEIFEVNGELSSDFAIILIGSEDVLYDFEEDEEWEWVEEEEPQHDVESGIDEITVEEETVAELDDFSESLLVSLNTYLGCKIDNHIYLRVISTANEANGNRELLGYEPFPRNEKGYLVAPMQFWHIIYTQTIIAEDVRKTQPMGFKIGK